MAAPILWAPGILWFFLLKNPHAHKILLGGGFWVFLQGGGGSANFIFMGAGIFSEIPIFEANGQIRANRVFSPIRIEIRVIRIHSSLLSIFWKVDSQKNGYLRSENRFAENIRGLRANRESIRANRPTKSGNLDIFC